MYIWCVLFKVGPSANMEWWDLMSYIAAIHRGARCVFRVLKDHVLQREHVLCLSNHKKFSVH